MSILKDLIKGRLFAHDLTTSNRMFDLVLQTQEQNSSQDDENKLDSSASQSTKSVSPSANLEITLTDLMNKLEQAHRNGDFKEDSHGAETNLMEQAQAMLKSLNEFKISSDKSKKESARAWFETNKKTVEDFFAALDTVYKNRTTSAKIKDFLWEVADYLLAAAAAVGITLAVMHGVPTTGVDVVQQTAATAAGTAGVVVGLVSFFRRDKTKIEDAIKQDLEASYPATVPSSPASS